MECGVFNRVEFCKCFLNKELQVALRVNLGVTDGKWCILAVESLKFLAALRFSRKLLIYYSNQRSSQ